MEYEEPSYSRSLYVSPSVHDKYGISGIYLFGGMDNQG
jgi:hypothetical protein